MLIRPMTRQMKSYVTYKGTGITDSNYSGHSDGIPLSAARAFELCGREAIIMSKGLQCSNIL